MRGCHRWAVCTVPVLLVAATTSAAGPTAGPPGPVAREMKGTWSCSLSHAKVSGICPLGPRQTGTCEIGDVDGVVTLAYTSGVRCSPKAACRFTCAESDGALNCQNSGPADDEGGRYATTLVLKPTSATQASGTAKSSYSHPDMRCEWKTSLAFTRPPTPSERR